MRTAKALVSNGVLALSVMALTVVTAQADFSTERPGSILIFPKVVFSATQDTVIQITNTSNITRQAHCYYVDGSPLNPNLPPGPTNPARWQVTDFEIALTKQQPTYWVASLGRQVDPTAAPEGIDPGLVPPVPAGFTGELVCAEVDSAGSPIAGNSLKGEATIGATAGTDLAKYNAIAVQGLAPNSDSDLALDNVEYSACPGGLLVNFQSEGSTDAVIDALGGGAGSVVSSTLTLVPCAADFLNAVGSSVTVHFDVWNEFEELFDASTSVDCWGSVSLGDTALGGVFSTITPYGTARLTPVAGDGVGVLGVLSSRRVDTSSGLAATADTNLHFIGNDANSSLAGAVIRLRGF